MQTKAPTKLITDRLLAELAAPNAQDSLGEWDHKTRAMLAVAIPEMAAELLRMRHVGQIRQAQAETHARTMRNRKGHAHTTQQSLQRARDIIRAPDPIPARTLVSACQTLLMHSQDAAERSAAQQIIKEMEAAA